MKILILTITLLFSSAAFADNFYVSAALGYHDEAKDCPEFCFGSDILARLAAGWRGDIAFVDISHTSAPEIKEIGYGGNVIFAGAEYRF